MDDEVGEGGAGSEEGDGDGDEYGGGAFFVFVEAGGDEGPELVEPDG